MGVELSAEKIIAAAPIPPRGEESFHRPKDDGGGVNDREVNDLDISEEKTFAPAPIPPRARRDQTGPTGSVHDRPRRTSKLKAKGVELQVLAMNLDTSTPAGKLMLNLMGSFAEFEREIMLERQREPRGISTLGETAQAKIPE
jgi:hypothetical protein